MTDVPPRTPDVPAASTAIAVQPVPAGTAPTAGAATLATTLLRPDVSVDQAIATTAGYLLTLPRVETVVSALTTFPPDDPTGWTSLGGRAWLREWRRAGTECRIVPAPGAGPEAALTMPWMSQQARHRVIAITDIDLLPPEAAQDRRELSGCGVGSFVVSGQFASGTMLGSLSLVSSTTGPWPASDLADYQLLTAALTSRMTLEQARRSLTDAITVAEDARTKQEHFFGAIGHELRTPLSAITAYAEVLAEEAELHRARPRPDAPSATTPTTGDEHDDFAAMVARHSRVILSAGDQLLAVVEDLLRTARVVGEDETGDVDVLAAVADVLHWHRATAEPTKVTLAHDVSEGLVVRARGAGFRQALTNLVGNAIVHNKPGGAVSITAERFRGEHGEPRIRVAVRDNGPGLSEQQLATIFEPFVRFAGPRVDGTGLGLSLARAVVERDGGTIGATSVLGEGSVFWIDLPAAS